MRKKRFVVGGMGILLFVSFLNAKFARLEITGSYFYPSEKAFREIYGQGGKFGIDISRNIWKNLEFHLEIHYFSKRGYLTFTRERTRVKIIPLGANLRYVFLRKKIQFYAGAGLTYNHFEEKNPIGRVKESKAGISVKVGGYKKVKGLKKFIKEFIIGAYIDYNYCRMKPAEIEIDIGGLDLGVALGFDF